MKASVHATHLEYRGNITNFLCMPETGLMFFFFWVANKHLKSFLNHKIFSVKQVIFQKKKVFHQNKLSNSVE